MPRRQTLFAPDVYYHFYNRGNNRQAVFFQPANYLYFLKRASYLVCYRIASTRSFAIAFAPASFGRSPKLMTNATLLSIFTHNSR